jgi:uncharacterized protein (TIGR02001 family)
MKFSKLSLVVILVISTVTSTLIADDVSISANVSATNNYVWRGMTQSANKTALQGGMDIGYRGLYLGTWMSNVDFGSPATTEIDAYVGYDGDIAGIEYDLGYIRFAYLNEGDADFEEAYFGLSKNFGLATIGATYSIGIDDAPDDIAVEASVGLPQDYSLDLGWGDYDTVGTRYSVGVSKRFDKIDFSIGYNEFTHDTIETSDEKNIVLSIGTEF